MKTVLLLFVLLGFGMAQAAEPAAQAESCDQIRQQIKAHSGVPAKPNTNLLGKVGANEQCRFSSAEAYRAAWGDKPMPKDQTRNSRRKAHGQDD